MSLYATRLRPSHLAMNGVESAITAATTIVLLLVDIVVTPIRLESRSGRTLQAL
jgi:hypothetical protein